MPQKAKFSKEEIIEASLAIVENEGIETLTARSLGKSLGSSARPIFTTFNNMEEVNVAVIEKAKQIYNGYIEDGLKEELAFKGVGKAYITFAGSHSKLFQLLFMKEMKNIPHLDSILGEIDDSYAKILNSITKNYAVSQIVAKKLYEHLWVYSHGIAVLIATKMCKFEPEQISEMLTEVFLGLLKKFKSEESL